MVNERIDEATGAVKEMAGKVTGNEVQEAQGKAQAEAARVKRETEGTIDQGKGAIKQGVGDLTGNQDLKDQGAYDKAKGEVKKL